MGYVKKINNCVCSVITEKHGMQFSVSYVNWILSLMEFIVCKMWSTFWRGVNQCKCVVNVMCPKRGKRFSQREFSMLCIHSLGEHMKGESPWLDQQTWL